jgi:hypothetical protein
MKRLWNGGWNGGGEMDVGLKMSWKERRDSGSRITYSRYTQIPSVRNECALERVVFSNLSCSPKSRVIRHPAKNKRYRRNHTINERPNMSIL